MSDAASITASALLRGARGNSGVILSLLFRGISKHLKGMDEADGVLLAATTVAFSQGESVFNVLQRTMKQQKLHLEFVQTPLYNSAYIEGICNLYAFDAGDLSGWMYSVNGVFPNYGCSQYTLQDGDAVCWVYTCDLGADVGAESTGGNNQ